jgi:4a-hydroxytetrahydrobiopterin dehydratase
LKGHKDWQLDGDALKKEWMFKDFPAAMQFINKIATTADKYHHHPELFNGYNRVTLCYSTHDAGGLTSRDFRAAAEIDKL